MIRHSDFERTMGYADKALDHLRTNHVPAYPRNYELWYTHVSGFNRGLSRALNEAITQFGQVPESVLGEIYEQHLSPSRVTDRVDAISSKFLKEFEAVLGAVDEVKGSTESYGKSLQSAQCELDQADNHDQVRKIVHELLAATHEMEGRSLAMERQLEDSRRQIDQLHANLVAVRAETVTDALTGIANRKHFDYSIKQAIRDAEEGGEPLSLLLGDIDHFKQFNDNFGHQTGDQVLRLVAHAMKTNVKGRDLAARYGGEEFAIILPHTALTAAVTVAEQIRRSIMAKELVKKSTGESLGTITMSFGAAQYRPGETIDSLIARADVALYDAKRAGRNRVKAANDAAASGFTDVA